MMEVVLMIRTYKATRSEVLLSDLRHVLLIIHVLLPEIAAGIALVLLLVLLPILAAIL